MNANRRWIIALLVQIVALGAMAMLAVCVGTTRLSVGTVMAALVHQADPVAQAIVLELRIPRVLLAIAVGGGLSLAGVLLQGMFRNPLVEPYTLGISGGASLGICVGVVLKIGSSLGGMVFPLLGFLGAVGTTVLVYGLGARRGVLGIREVVLVGVMVSFVCSSLVMLVMAMSRAEDLYGILFWTMGSLEQPSRGLLGTMLGVSGGALVLSYGMAIRMNALALGEDEARNLGIEVEQTKRILFMLAALLTGVCVSVAGIIGFIGLVVPHLARLLVGRDHRLLLVSAFLGGGIFLLACDTVARTVAAPLEVPIGVVTGIVGGSLFIHLLKRRGAGAVA